MVSGPIGFSRAAVLLLAAFLLTRDVGSRFNGWHELNSAMYTLFARNHVELGLGATGLFCTWDAAPTPDAPAERYLNHPPLIALWVAIPLFLLGDREWAARLVPIAASLGSAWLLMLVFGRLAGRLQGALAGYFFAVLPLTAYFGRMIDHVAPAQLFTLLMLHGYLDWTGVYPGRARRAAGAACYTAGAVLGIGTAWACLLAAALVWIGHAIRVARRAGEARLLILLAVVPGLALVAVVAHILSSGEFTLGSLAALLLSRSTDTTGVGPPWPDWLKVQGSYALRNFTSLGVLAAAACVIASAAAAWRRSAPTWGGLAFRGPAAAVAGFSALHGLLYLLLFRRAAWFHDYWQLFLGPFVAMSLAQAALALRGAAAAAAPRAAPIVLAALLAAPLPGLLASLSFYRSARLVDPEHLEALAALEPLIPRRAPACTSRPVQVWSETLSGRTRHWPNPVIAYYAHRPLFYSRDEREIVENAPGCAAYVLRLDERGWSSQLERALAARYRAVRFGERHVIFVLGEPR